MRRTGGSGGGVMPDRYDLRRGTIHRAYAESIYPTMEQA